jgi:hypothetical protein
MRFVCHGNDCPRTRNQNDKYLDSKKPLEFVWWCEHYRRLHAPEYKVCYHFRGCYTGVFGEVVWNVQERWPDGADDLSHWSFHLLQEDGEGGLT